MVYLEVRTSLRRVFDCKAYLASLEYPNAYHAVKHLKIEENLDTADYKLIFSTLDDAFGYYEEEEKYMVVDKIFGVTFPNHESRR